ncbi:staphylocoagulase [Staphylococcus argenteus]|uniref:staphylocoagulase n=1 Tax=Staphylococcus argenteus TaxID=985002 RepID=UPI0011B16C06|nr:staphylocoagulase [Staphylococcus argenteus]QDZ03850.1 coagulase [Staphylococcus argenteus]HDY9521119.1 staphylocoagulase [Staphylococcus argenteus]HDY9570376.1 staphylocoagulase [Staphylococcus argenteus]HDY9572846.1 staphylocoagulase [Staphylococcus argenteus]
MKKQIISLGALAVASSLFTWDNKADAIVGKDYSKESRVNENSKYDSPMSNWYYWEKVQALESQFARAVDIIEDYQYGEKEYKNAKEKLMTRVLGEDQYLLKKKIDEYKKYRESYLKAGLKPVKFFDYNLYDFTMKEYNDIQQSLKDAMEEFYKEVKEIQAKNTDLQTFDKKTEDEETDKIYSLVSEIDTLVATYYGDKDYVEHAKELRAKLDIILGEEKKPNRITNERIRKEMMDDLNSIIDDFFMETGQNRPNKITKYDPRIHNPKDNKANFEALVKETKDAVAKADDSWKTKTVKSYGKTDAKTPVVKEEKKVEEIQQPKAQNIVGETEKAPLPVAQPLVKIPQGTITGEIVQGPKYPTMEQKTIQGEIVKGPDFPTMEQSNESAPVVTPSLSGNYTEPTIALPTITGESKVENPIESTLKGIQGESSNIEIKPQVSETREASQYGTRPQFNKTPKYVKYRDAGTGIREYNDGTFGYEARPRFNKPSETNAYNVTTHANGQVTYGARPTTKKPAETNAYNVTTHANGQVTYGARPTQNKPSKTNAYNVTTHANGQVTYGARPAQNKPSKTNAYNVTTYANGQVSYGARPAQNKPSKTNAYNVTTHANGQVTYGARPAQNKPSKTNAYNVTTHADGTATYGPRVTK